MATNDRNEWVDSGTGDMFYLDDNGNLRRMVPLPKTSRLLTYGGRPRRPFKPSPVPDSLREWVTGKKA